MQIKLVLRACISLLWLITMMVVVGISIGQLFPTTVIVAQTKSGHADTIGLAVFDVNRNVSVHLRSPLLRQQTGTFSGDGRLMIIPTNDFQFVVWDIFAGRVITFPENYRDCAVLDDWRWLDDDQKVLFQCRHHDGYFMMGGVHILNIEDGNFYPVYYRQNNHTSSLIISPDEQSFLIFDNGWHRVDIHTRTTTEIPTKERYFYLMAWLPDNQALIGFTNNTLEYYDFASSTWDILFDDNHERQVSISPNGEWIATLSDEKPPVIQTLHVPTRRITTIHSNRYRLDRAVYVGWSTDSQYLQIRVAPYRHRESNRYYLVHPANQFITPLAENLTVNPIWSPNERMVSYYTFNLSASSTPQLYILDMTQYLTDGVAPEPIISYATGVKWSHNSTDIAFIHYHPDMRYRALGFYNPQRGVRLLSRADENVLAFTFVNIGQNRLQ